MSGMGADMKGCSDEHVWHDGHQVFSCYGKPQSSCDVAQLASMVTNLSWQGSWLSWAWMAAAAVTSQLLWAAW